MFMDLVVKIPQITIKSAFEEISKIPCLRKQTMFELQNNSWKIRYSCDGFGNGYGVGQTCKETCRLRITDISKCRKEKGLYMVQDEFFKNVNEDEFI